MKKIIMIDDGHGGKDPGAIGGFLKEDDVTLKAAVLLKNTLVNMGYDARITRPTDKDMSLSDRVRLSNNVKADLFISLHCNSAEDHTAHGIETFAYKQGGTAEKIARSIQTNLVKKTGLTNRGVKFANFYVLHYTVCPAVLVEMGFISNLSEEKKLSTDQFLHAVVLGITEAVKGVI